ncbi:mediator of RNA polymerase II transcription subunit 33A-like [Canna indica]|uniref:Mediator of RNA polymerase II transcription subunit 33A-like n=1 Tax=Canna indica TaxID=4628 RepID=A0AAQ3KF76_9LILI|nr:mediator of RNA polymerase II transcription subunit 33A-like [Canna indica]
MAAAMELDDVGDAFSDLERRVMSAVKMSEERGDPPLLRAVEAARCVQERGLGLPNPELAQVLVSNICFANNTSSLWKLLDQAMASRVVSPIHTLALLTSRVIPCRREQPEAYRLYLELVTRYSLSSLSLEAGACRDKIAKSIDDALQLSKTYGVQEMDFGHAIVLFFFSIITSLIDCTIEDCGCQLVSVDKHGNAYTNGGKLAMDIDIKGSSNEKRSERREHLRKSNALMAIEVAEKISSNKKAKAFLRLIHINMPELFNSLLQKLQTIEANRSTSESLLSSIHILDNLSVNIKKALSGELLLNKHQILGALVDAGSSVNPCNSFGAGKDACWVPLDIFMENAMDGRHLYAISAVEILSELTKTLQGINQATWQETFQALWLSALRLVQRDREPLEGPVPHLDARLCMLLSIVPLVVVSIVKEEREMPYPFGNNFLRTNSHGNRENKSSSRGNGLVSSLKLLGQFSALLSPPPSVVNAANNAATKAAVFVSNFKNGNGNLNAIGRNDSSIKAVGNMLHLIVEACIARNLIDTSAYFWPGYIVPSALAKDATSFQDSPWLTFLEGAPLTSLKNSLMVIPASSLVEVERLFQIIVNGSEEDKLAAAKILCGATLVRGWNVQEHVVRYVVGLLTPMSPDSSASGAGNHLIDHMSMLNVILFGVSCVDIVHILSLYGMIPEVAAALMPICEFFGSLSPLSSHRPIISDETSVYSVFSYAFLFLLRLWKFYRPPQAHCIAGCEGSVRVELTLDYLLLMRNSSVALQNSSATNTRNNSDSFKASESEPVYVDSFPKLQAWYFQNQACIASTLSGLSSNNPAHQVANKILNMIYRKMLKTGPVSGNASSNSSSSISGSPMNTAEDSLQRPMLPAWEILEAVPFVLEAILTACAHGRLSSRDLTTGLRDLVDFLPASLAAIISYFSAEITRGIWKPVPMNGTDWPSPAPTLLSVESEVKEILASVGVHIQSCYPCGSPPMLPLPMAALVSLTITFKLDKSLEHIHGVYGQALENCATNCTWPSMPIIGALWAQKVRRWHDFIVLACSRSPFSREKDAIVQLIRSCFSSFLGPPVAGGSHITSHRGVTGLLGQFMSEKGVRLPVAPGFLYLRTCRAFHDVRFFIEIIFKLVLEWVNKLATECGSGGPARLKSSRISLAAAASGVQQAATLGASLLFIAGGMQLVQRLYEETWPTMLLLPGVEKLGGDGPASSILQGYAMAYMLILCGALVWGVGNTSQLASVFSKRRARVIGIHMDFLAGALEGNIILGCDPATWKAYVSCFVGLLVNFAPAWVPEVKQESLRKLASGLRGWQECDLALSLLELGGPSSMTAVVESML